MPPHASDLNFRNMWYSHTLLEHSQTGGWTDSIRYCPASLFNPFECRGNYIVQRQLYCHIKQYEVGTLAVDGWAVIFGTARSGLGGTPASPGPSLLYQM